MRRLLQVVQPSVDEGKLRKPLVGMSQEAGELGRQLLTFRSGFWILRTHFGHVAIMGGCEASLSSDCRLQQC